MDKTEIRHKRWLHLLPGGVGRQEERFWGPELRIRSKREKKSAGRKHSAQRVKLVKLARGVARFKTKKKKK